jgi:hypothetical protein
VAVIGAWGDADNGFYTGSAYVYEQQADGTWQQTAKLTADDGASLDSFGGSVALDAGVAVIGATGDDNGSQSGSAYVYEQQADGTWQQIAKLTADDGASNDSFGRSVATSGGVAVIGARYDADNGHNSGSAYVYEQQADGTWQQTAKLTADDGDSYDNFGTSVALDAGVAVIGAYLDEDNGDWSGSAYVYEQQADGTWQQIAKLTADDGDSYDNFGISVATSGGVAVIGARYDDHNAVDSGSAYIYESICIGACCLGDGDGCSMTTSDKCSGEWLGEGINCDEIICEPFGACCINDTCTVTIEAWCSGTWLGDFTDCTGGPCGAPDPMGACCIDFTCTLSTELDCSGEWLGEGTDCSGSPCGEPEPIGACCITYTCSISTELDCDGEWLGDGTNCLDSPCEPGACCIDFQCTVTMEIDCDGTWLGEFINCTGGPCGAPDPIGACCTGVACSDLTGIDCQSIGGTWFGEQIACSDSPCDGVTHVVPTDYPTIQSAVNAAQHGDTILVMPGIYTSTGGEVVKLNGKAISLVSQSTYGAIIDGDGTRRGIVCTAGEGPTTSISGFMVRNCWTGGGGGGFLIGESSSPTIENCLIRNNVAGSAGGGILSSGASNPTISGTTICGNSPDQIAGNWDDGGSNEITEECPPDVIGACCIDFQCTVTTESDCSGEWLGEGTDCSGSPCGNPDGMGVCCINEICTETTQQQCEGTWFGEGTSCQWGMCTFPSGYGACCLDSICTEVDEFSCIFMGGGWLGDGSTCDDYGCVGSESIAIRWQVVGPDRLSGATANYTVDVFVELPAQWRLDAVAGNSTQQKMVASTTSFYQDIYGGPTSQEVNPDFYPLAPDLRWDSRVTIGCLDSSGMPFNENTLNTIGIDWSTFENGGDLSVGNGTWFVLPIDEQGMSQPFVDSDCTTRNGVHIARLTTMEHSAEILFEALFQGRDASNATWQDVVAGTIQYAGEQDCNDNGSPDECDILSGQSADTNLDGIPDECACLADLNGDGIVDVTDILSLIEHFGTTGPQGDVDGDGFVGVDDLLILINAWGPCP